MHAAKVGMWRERRKRHACTTPQVGVKGGIWGEGCRVVQKEEIGAGGRLGMILTEHSAAAEPLQPKLLKGDNLTTLLVVVILDNLQIAPPHVPNRLHSCSQGLGDRPEDAARPCLSLLSTQTPRSPLPPPPRWREERPVRQRRKQDGG